MKNINDLKREYKKVGFKVRCPILDIGGGDGSFLESQKIIDATIIDATKNKGTKYKYINADLTKKLPKLDKKFNTIFIMEVLEHLRNPLYLLVQAYDLLEPDGKCYISIPYTPIGENMQHVCRWKLKEIINQSKKLGFNTKILEKRRRFRGLAFFLPHCWLVLELTKQKISSNKTNIKDYSLNFDDE
jgi:2-polyprenyl-3-methyl-5-hydroxy-6-metoxy-1,4-benzoquinol methylase